MKNVFKFNFLAVLLLSVPVFAVDGMAVIDMRTAVLSTQVAADAFKALEEDADYSSNLEEAQSLQAERQAIEDSFANSGQDDGNWYATCPAPCSATPRHNQMDPTRPTAQDPLPCWTPSIGSPNRQQDSQCQ